MDELKVVAARNLRAYIRSSGLRAPDRTSALLCVDVLAGAEDATRRPEIVPPPVPNIRVECDHFFKRRNCPGCYEGVEPGKEPYRP